MIERKAWRRTQASLAVCLLLACSATALAQQQNQTYYPYGYYQAPQPGNYQWAPRDNSGAQQAAPQAAAAPQQAAPSTPSTPASGAPQTSPPAAEGNAPTAVVAPQAQVVAGSAKTAGNGLPAGMQVVGSRLGPVLADAQGRTLYIFDREAAGVPLCEGECARLWPPLLSDGNSAMAAPFFLLPREDGSRQWAWNGRPLYRWIGDHEAGDVTGDGMNGVWHALRMR